MTQATSCSNHRSNSAKLGKADFPLGLTKAATAPSSRGPVPRSACIDNVVYSQLFELGYLRGTARGLLFALASMIVLTTDRF